MIGAPTALESERTVFVRGRTMLLLVSKAKTPTPDNQAESLKVTSFQVSPRLPPLWSYFQTVLVTLMISNGSAVTPRLALRLVFVPRIFVMTTENLDPLSRVIVEGVV